MNANEPGSPRPVPKPPATGPDAWKNQPTSCWPTPASMAKARSLRTPLDPTYGDEPTDESPERLGDGEQPVEDRWEDEGGADDDEPSSIDAPRDPASPAPRDPASPSPRGTDDTRRPLGTDPDMPERFRSTVGRLDELPERAVNEHADSYDAVHRDLRKALDDIERPS